MSLSIRLDELITSIGADVKSIFARLTPIDAALTSTTTAGTATDIDYYYSCTGTWVLTIPTPVGHTNKYCIINVGSGIITITAPAGLLEGATTFDIYTSESVELRSINGMWRIF